MMKQTMEGILTITALLVLAGCGREAGVEPAPLPDPKDSIALAPAITAPAEIADPVQPPSYEVSVASAAADRNKSLARCAEQPEAVRAQCEQEANAAFAEADADLQDLRGNQQ